jgi:putative hemolysin
VPEFQLSTEEERKYSTLGGYVCERLGHIPKEGEHFEDRGFRFEVIDMDRLRVDKVLMSQVKAG